MIPVAPFLIRAAIAGLFSSFADDILDAIMADTDNDGTPDVAEHFMRWMRRKAKQTPNKFDDRAVRGINQWLREHPEHWSMLRSLVDAQIATRSKIVRS